MAERSGGGIAVASRGIARNDNIVQNRIAGPDGHSAGSAVDTLGGIGAMITLVKTGLPTAVYIPPP
jgi:hypothetical protein